jgi:hypothetical protein
MSESTPPLVTRKGITWPFILKLVAWGMPLLLAALLAYARATFVERSEFDLDKLRLSDHSSESQVRFKSLEEFKSRAEIHEVVLNETLQNIAAAQNKQAALLESMGKGQERIFNRIDQLADRNK